MKEGTKRTARLSLLCALAIGFLYLGSIIPGAQIAVIALAGFLSAVAVMMYSAGWAALVFFASALISLIILPDKDCALLYTCFFGFYPIVKSLFERNPNRKIGWLLKLLTYTAGFLLWWFVAVRLLTAGNVSLPWYLLWPAGALAFVVYDVCLSFLITIYIERISGYIK